MPIYYPTILALVAFAGNSVLCRCALEDGAIDPVSFTSIRLVGGAVALAIVCWCMRGRSECRGKQSGSWGSGIVLYVYAISFSFAYISLSSGTGALILFGAVQMTMLIAVLKGGEKIQSRQWLGFVVAIMGMVYLVSPGISEPDFRGALLMMISGMAWGFYSLAGKTVTAPIAMTAGNFIRASIIALPAGVIAIWGRDFSALGVSLALVSGVVTSGLGYAMWYQVLPRLSTTRAAILQLLVPLLAAFGGVMFLSEDFSFRLALSSFLILGGVVCAILAGDRDQEQLSSHSR